jgi:(2Fe-2S) ferredoxin
MKQELEQAAAKINIGKLRRHVFLCTGPSCCTPEVGLEAWEALKASLKNAGVTDCARTKVGCLRICNHGPTAVVYPEGTWYHGMTAERIPRLVEQHLINGEPVDEWVFAKGRLAE